ncbi:hypothetical protein [Geomesophilobacter sediminis]|uniref:Uncharacterized protein n=1 Tax=Geomesophilobacter sediminis TaxID=2798584 RepID=A0A8J7LYK9_9BACT|nr:hypothetical protein [Geomesophilobacter sediminis]MBJ6724987.1 hypothetical protein [Geomesophilobacter sediminis]
MARVHIDDLAAGMVLQQQVCDRSGRMLLPAGEALNDRHLHIFRMWGVVEVEIVGEEIASDAEQDEIPPDPELHARERAVVEELFAHNDPNHPAIKELMRVCIHRRIARAA